MFGPGAYRPDPTEGMTAIADLPQSELVPYSRNDKRNVCPRCGHVAYRDKQSQRTLHDLGNLDLWCPRALVITYSQHHIPSDLVVNGYGCYAESGWLLDIASVGQARRRDWP